MTISVSMVDPQDVILREIADRSLTRDDVALTYAFCIRQSGEDEIDFPTINAAILERWSMAALRYIKREAWERLS